MDDFFAASAASISSNLVTHPFETIKVRQVIYGKPIIYTVKHLIQTEGVKALYKGLSSAVLRAAISGAGRLGAFNQLKRIAIEKKYLTSSGKNNPSEFPLRSTLAIFGACIATFVASPVDLIRTVQAKSTGTSSAPSIYAVGKSVVKNHGIKGLWNGTGALLGRSATFNFAQLLSYDSAKQFAANKLNVDESNVKAHVGGSVIAGFFATVASCPFENIKTRMQAEAERKSGVNNLGQMIMKMYKEDGFKIYFRGFGPLYMKIAPHTLCCFVVLEQLRLTFNIKSY